MATAATETKHTAGPWAQSHRQRRDGMWSTEVYDSAGETIATLAWYPVHLPNGSMVTAREANARLISISPDLLATLQTIVNLTVHPYFPQVSNLPAWHASIATARALIAKAPR
jgi:hypothetical protein